MVRRETVAVILSSRETPTVLMGSIDAVLRDPGISGGILDVVVNGNRKLSGECAAMLHGKAFRAEQPKLRLWWLPLGDKAHAWNTYVHEIWPGGACTVFIDGYVRIGLGSISRLAGDVKNGDKVLGATGVPSFGRSANRLRREMERDGGIHGNLYALNQTAMCLTRSHPFRLPLGLYRTDALLAAVMKFRFAPSVEPWDPGRIKVLTEVSWEFDALRWWHPRDWRIHWRRLMRQGQGRLENCAVKFFLANQKIAPEQLPSTAASLVEAWIEADPRDAAKVLKLNPLLKNALHKLRQPRNWDDAELAPRLVWESPQSTQSSLPKNADPCDGVPVGIK